MIYRVMVGGKRVNGHLFGGQEFRMDEQDTFYDVYDYCEKQYGFTGGEWEKVKSEDWGYEDLETFLKAKGIEFDKWVE